MLLLGGEIGVQSIYHGKSTLCFGFKFDELQTKARIFYTPFLEKDSQTGFSNFSYMTWMSLRIRFIVGAVLIAVFFTKMAGQPLEVTDAATAPFTPDNLITNVFLGEGVEVLNVNFEGDPKAIGFFKNGTNAVGLNRGIIMTTGSAATQSAGLLGADATGGEFASNDNTSNTNDPDLAIIANGAIFDATKFTITFIPIADTLRFRYVFASEEYPEFACSDFNDVFGFFISGPGINGPFQNNGENIALIPGTAQPVAINNIHPQNGASCPPKFQQFYNDNNATALQPVYDGILDVFIAEAVVIPCETYTIKLMITDVGDDIFDSGVFLEAKSFGTGTLEVVATTVSLDGSIAEDCGQGTLTFSLPNPALTDFPIDYTIIGTAENGVDYEFIPSYLFIPAGERSVSVPLIAIEDSLVEPLETIGIDVQRDICNRDTIFAFIRDKIIIPPELGPDTLICRGDSVLLDGSLNLPLPPPPSFTNETDLIIDRNEISFFSPILVAGVQPLTLGPGVIQSVCINIDHNWLDDLDLFLVAPNGQFIELSTDNGSNCDDYVNTCFTPTATTPITFLPVGTVCSSGEQAPYTGNFQIEGTWSDLWGSSTNGLWQLQIIDDAQGFIGTLLDWTITFEPLYQLFYRWEPTQGLSCADCPNPLATPNQTTTYKLTAFDTYGCEVSDSLKIDVLDVLPPPNVVCGTITTTSIAFDWDPLSGAQGFQVNVGGTGWIDPNNGALSHLISGLNLSDTISLEVRGLSNCDGLIGSTVCWTPPCDAPQIAIEDLRNVDCNGDTDGSVSLSASGGNGGYSFQLGAEINSTGVFSSLPANTYEVTVTDNLNCPNFIQITIAEPEKLTLTPFIISQAKCNGSQDGSATVAVTGGTKPYNFDWNNAQTDSIATNLASGIHSVLVTDANGCSANRTLEITEPDALALQTDSAAVKCFGGNDGSATVMPSGGTAPYSIQWDAAAANQNSETAVNLAAGTYQALITDDNGCSITTSVSVEEPPELTASTGFEALNCNGSGDGTATVIAVGGTPDYTYLWSNGAVDSTATPLDAETYTVTITDANNCTTEASVTLTQPPSLEVSLTPLNVNCFDGTDGLVAATASGGTVATNYTFQWSNNSADSTLSGLPAGTYCVTVLDDNGCQVEDCATVGEPPALELATHATNTGCNTGDDGTIDLMVNGGSGPFTILWNTGSSAEDLTALAAGTFSATVTDSHNCVDSISTVVGENNPLGVGFLSNPVNCFGENNGSIETFINGSSGNISFHWAGPDNYNSNERNPSNLTAGLYFLSLQDNDGCSLTDSILVEQPAAPLIGQPEVKDISCPGFRDGRITLFPEGGTPPYSFSLDGKPFSSGGSFNALQEGFYNITTKDANGCLHNTGDLFITEPAPILLDLGPDTTINFGQSVRLIPDIQNVSDLTALTYNWTANDTAAIIERPNWRRPTVTVKDPTTFRLTVTNSNGCTATDLLTVFVRKTRYVIVPTGFSPNGHIANRFLHVHGSSSLTPQVKLFRVFDRWGELLYQATDFAVNDLSVGWDGTFKGKEMPSGVYVWYLEIEFEDGLKQVLKGNTTLIR